MNKLILIITLLISNCAVQAMEPAGHNVNRGLSRELPIGKPLYSAAYMNDLNNVRDFLNNKAPVDSYIDDQGRTALLVAAARTINPPICKLLIDAGAKVNHTDNFGRTALMHALKTHRIEICKLLIRARAHVFHADKDGLTALHYAIRYEWLTQQTDNLVLERMLSIPDKEQAQRVDTFLKCLLRNHPLHYSNLRNVFKDLLYAMIKDENMRNPESRARKEVNKLKNGKEKQCLLQKYFQNNPNVITQ